MFLSIFQHFPFCGSLSDQPRFFPITFFHVDILLGISQAWINAEKLSKKRQEISFFDGIPVAKSKKKHRSPQNMQYFRGEQTNFKRMLASSNHRTFLMELSFQYIYNSMGPFRHFFDNIRYLKQRLRQPLQLLQNSMSRTH